MDAEIPCKGMPPYKATKYLEKLIETVPEIKRQFIPTRDEKEADRDAEADPLGEEDNVAVPRLVHKYANRALIWATSYCFSNCRFCTRRRLIKKKESTLTDGELDRVIKYLTEHKEITDVILSGGDPLVLPNMQLKNILVRLRKVETISLLRIGTRAPIVEPRRITNKLVALLSKFSPLIVNVHVNHPAELTDDVKRACDLMTDSGIMLGSQTVLLKGVNDNKEVMAELMQKLLTFRIRPYYLYTCDKVQGTKHFWVKEDVGLEIMEHLQKTVSGLAIPRFVRDTADRKIYL